MKLKLGSNIREELFWDIDLNRFNFQNNRRLVIERVFCLGTISEFKAILDFYGERVVKAEITRADTLDKKPLAFASRYLNIPLTEFRCYIKNLIFQCKKSGPVY